MTFYRLSKLAAKCNQDLLPSEKEKCFKDTLVIDGDICISKAFDFY